MRKFNARHKQSEAINPDLLTWTLKTDCDRYRILNLALSLLCGPRRSNEQEKIL